MKKKAMLLAVLLGVTSLSGCHAINALTEADVKDWDTPLEMLNFDQRDPSVKCSAYLNEKNEGSIQDNKKQIKELLVKQEYQKVGKINPTTEDYIIYHTVTPYFEYTTVKNADLKIYADGNIELTVNTSKNAHKFFYTIDKENAMTIYTQASAYINERVELEKVCQKDAEEELKIENFINRLKSDTNAVFNMYISRLECLFDRDDDLIDLIATTKHEKAINHYIRTPSFKIDMTKHDDSFGDSSFTYKLSDDYTYVSIEDRIIDNYELTHVYYAYYSINASAGKNIYDTARELVRQSVA